jgi:LacI family transcriptional regulator
VTILDVARAAGVTPSTVSKALNGGHGSADVRRRVYEAATRLDYRPNERARGLRRAQSRSIGVLVPDLANPVFLPFLRGVEQVAQERGYVVLIADGQRSPDVQRAALERFFDQGVDGVVLGGPFEPGPLELFLDHGVPVAPRPFDERGRRVRHWEAGESAATGEMADRLVALGHRRFAFVGVPVPRGSSTRAYRRGRLGVLAARVEAAGGEVTVARVDPTLGFAHGRQELRAFLADARPTAVVCGSHVLVPWTLVALRDARLRIPRDVSVVAYGDSDWALAYGTELSVVTRDLAGEGRDLAAALLDELADGDRAHRPVTVVSRYVERGSCAPVRARDAARA